MPKFDAHYEMDEHEFETRWASLVDELRAEVRKDVDTQIEKSPLSASKPLYREECHFEDIENGIRITLGNDAKFSLPAALEKGQKSFDLKPGYARGNGDQSPRPPPRGAIIFRKGPGGRIIPIDSGYPYKGTPSGWIHPGLYGKSGKGLGILTKRVRGRAYLVTLPRLYRKLLAGGSDASGASGASNSASSP